MMMLLKGLRLLWHIATLNEGLGKKVSYQFEQLSVKKAWIQIRAETYTADPQNSSVASKLFKLFKGPRMIQEHLFFCHKSTSKSLYR